MDEKAKEFSNFDKEDASNSNDVEKCQKNRLIVKNMNKEKYSKGNQNNRTNWRTSGSI